MMQPMQSADDFLQLGIEAIKAGRLDEGRRYLAQSLKLDPNSENAWIWMSGVVDDRQHRIDCLQRALAINPHNETAIKGLRALGALDAPPTPPPAQPAAESAPPAAIPVEQMEAPLAAPAPAPAMPGPPPPPRPPAPDGLPPAPPATLAPGHRPGRDLLLGLL